MSEEKEDRSKWEYHMFYAGVGGTMNSDPSKIWNKKLKELQNRTYWDLVVEAGNNGWEMVSASPWCDKGDGLTTGMVFVFKRKK